MYAARIFAFLLLIATGAAEAAPPRVAASIKPVHAIVSAVMTGIAAPSLLMKGANSPHSYAMKPSDARLLAEADLVFWIGPDMETFLQRPLASLASRAKITALMDAPGMRLLPAREGGLWGETHDHDHGPRDGHVWFDPRNGAAMAHEIASVLGRSDRANASSYAANAVRFAAELRALDAKISRLLSPVKSRPFLVFHDAFHYFDARYGLSPAGAVTVAADRPIGVRRAAELRLRIARAGALCIFAPPQFPPALLTALTEGTRAKIVALDDLGAGLAEGPALYENLLMQTADRMASCLGSTR